MTRVDEEIRDGWYFFIHQAEKTNRWMDTGIDGNFFCVNLTGGPFSDDFKAMVQAKMRALGWFQLEEDYGTLRYCHTLNGSKHV